MWKITFNNKKVKRFNDNRVTIVTLSGTIRLPKNFRYIINSEDPIFDCIDLSKNPKLEWSQITAVGKAIRSYDDTIDNPVLAERIAESRAKIKLYDFVMKLCERYYKYITILLVGRPDNIPILPINSKKYKADSLFWAYQKYTRLYNTEIKHLNILLYGE